MRRLWLVVVLVVVVSVLVPGTSDVAEAQTDPAGLCDGDSVSRFSDVQVGDYGADYILCMKALGLSVGRADGSYGAGLELTRAQMAAFLVRLWQDVLGKRCPKDVETPFVDVAGNTHEESIDCLYGLEITKGTTAVTYGPGEKLKGSQIALFLARLYEGAGNSCRVGGEGVERAVRCLAGLRVIPSEAEGSSLAPVTRAQMAVYVVGLWHNMAGRGLPPRPPARPVDYTYVEVSAGLYLSCGVRTDGGIDCWGNNERGQADPPEQRFVSVSAGGEHVCGLRADSSVRCWGSNDHGLLSEPGGEFAAVSAGGEFTCGLRGDGAVECWGNNEHNQAFHRGGRYSTVSAGRSHACGVRTDGNLRCWGRKDHGRTMPPEGRFGAVSAGGEHSCGIGTDGEVVCWGNDRYGQADPPGGRFLSVSAGGEHTCGLRTDKTITCWGRSQFGQTNAPGGRFDEVSSGRFHSCGLRTDKTITCWGNNRYGELDTPTA